MRIRYFCSRYGFTLAELLIVIAIIGVLVAVSIPVFTSQLEKSREAVDAANVRAAKAAYASAYVSDNTIGDQYYNAVSGILQSTRADIAGYGKGTSAGADIVPHTGQILKCSSSNNSIDITWVNGALDSSVTINDMTPLLYLKTLVMNNSSLTAALAVKDSSINSTSTNNKNTQTITNALGNIFPHTNIAAWRITNESKTFTVTVTDVDITNLKDGEKVKVIRYNPNKGTYTAAYVKVRTGNDGINTLYIQTNLAEKCRYHKS
jgi:prepilin-type N-terminal cleavage/methylation domain-containing protein